MTAPTEDTDLGERTTVIESVGMGEITTDD
jgi:hypothetical protein